MTVTTPPLMTLAATFHSALRSAKADGRVGELSPRFYGLPTNRSQATTLKQDRADLLAMLQEDEVDLAILVAN